jgi:hypothetical protein
MDLLQSSCRVVEAVWVSIFLKSSPKLFFKRVFGVFFIPGITKVPLPVTQLAGTICFSNK